MEIFVDEEVTTLAVVSGLSSHARLRLESKAGTTGAIA